MRKGVEVYGEVKKNMGKCMRGMKKKQYSSPNTSPHLQHLRSKTI